MNIGLVVEGNTYSKITQNEQAKKDFLEITNNSKAIIICRASPS